MFAKSALRPAASYAQSRGKPWVTTEHLLYGILRDLDEPYGLPLGWRGRKRRLNGRG